MTQKDGSPSASEGPYWSEELLAVLVVGLGDETQARETLEGIIQQAQEGKAMRTLSTERLASRPPRALPAAHRSNTDSSPLLAIRPSSSS